MREIHGINRIKTAVEVRPLKPRFSVTSLCPHCADRLPYAVVCDLESYINERELYSPFLEAVLGNQFTQAIYQMPSGMTLKQLKLLCEFVRECVPDVAWRTPQRVKNYLAGLHHE